MTPCEDHCSETGGITLEDTLSLVKKLGNATAFADIATFNVQLERREEIIKQTTPQKEFVSTSTEPTRLTQPTAVTEVTKISVISKGGL